MVFWNIARSIKSKSGDYATDGNLLRYGKGHKTYDSCVSKSILFIRTCKSDGEKIRNRCDCYIILNSGENGKVTEITAEHGRKV